VSGTILSKRKLITLIEGQGPGKPNRGKYVEGWDDPRLFTLVGLRRRGIPPGAILSFVNELGVTKATAIVEIPRFENSVRSYLETTVPRLMLVLDPVPIIIENLPDDYVEMVEVLYSKDPTYGVRKSPHSGKPLLTRFLQTHLVPFTKTVYIERSDFREVGSESFFAKRWRIRRSA
jgi:glutaminyl-tRNA synthetase